MSEKKYIPIEGRLVEVETEVYYEYYRPIWRQIKQAQKFGTCRCTKENIWKCDGICPGCEYYIVGNERSFDVEIDGQEGITLADVLPDTESSPVEFEETKVLYDALHREIGQLSPLQKSICELVMKGLTEREIGLALGKSQSTINYQKKHAYVALRKALLEYL